MGSSPLTRGLLYNSLCCFSSSGIIPAHAGTTSDHNTAWQQHKDHPRSRGDYSSKSKKRSSVLGSSPLTRGLQCSLWHAKSPGGIIPAHAGTTRQGAYTHALYWDHPRSRGDYLQIRQLSPVRLGSSPLTRGLLLALIVSPDSTGIIPAHAGTTVVLYPFPACYRDHPRSRGDYRCTRSREEKVPGSSPLTRGLHLQW